MDPVLTRTRAASAKILREIASLPPDQQLAELDLTLRRFDPTLPAKLRKVSDYLRHQKGMTVKAAVHEALARTLADSAIDGFKKLGAQALIGQVSTVSGLGGLGLGNAGDTVVDMVRGLTCSTEVRSLVTDLVGRSQGATAADITGTGFTVAGAAAQCPAGTTPVASPPPPPPPPKPSLAVPLAIAGGAVLLVGVVMFAVRPK